MGFLPESIGDCNDRPSQQWQKRLKHSLLLALAGMAWSAPAAAQNQLSLPSIVVSPTLVPTPEEQIGSSVSVVTAADIERRQQRTVPEVLRAIPGVNVVQAGGPGGQTSVFIRGTESRHVKVLVDGIDVSDPSNPGRLFDFGHMQTFDIERIEVLRGPQSGLYGSDAIGGVISITTKKGEGPTKVKAMVEGGSFDTFNQGAAVSGSTSNFNYAFNFAHLHAGDTPVTPNRFVLPGTPNPSNYYDNKTASARLGFDIAPNLSFDYVARYTDSKLRYADLNFNTGFIAPFNSQGVTHQFYTRGEVLWAALDGRFKNRFGAAYTDIWNWNQTLAGTPTTNQGTREKYNWLGEFAVAPGHLLLGGVDTQTDRMKLSSGLVRSIDNTGAFVEWQSEFNKQFFIVANVRHDDNENYGQHTTWRVAPAFITSGGTKFKASAGTGFRAPSLVQLYVSFPPFFYANPDLRPETSFGYDFGFEQPLPNGMRFGATYFHNDIDDLIGVTGCGFFCTRAININKAKTYGAESFLEWQMTSRLRTRFDYTYTQTQDEATKLELLRRPPHKFSYQTTWQPTDPLTLTSTIIVSSSWADIDRYTGRRIEANGYTLINVAGEYAVNPFTTVFARLENAFGEYYETPSGYRAPGFGAFGGIRLKNRD